MGTRIWTLQIHDLHLRLRKKLTEHRNRESDTDSSKQKPVALRASKAFPDATEMTPQGAATQSTENGSKRLGNRRARGTAGELRER